MGIIDIRIPATIARTLKLPVGSYTRQQNRVLKKLLRKARYTEFGQAYHFDEILLHKRRLSYSSSMFRYLITIRFMNNGGIARLMVSRMFAGREDPVFCPELRHFGFSQQVHTYYQRPDEREQDQL